MKFFSGLWPRQVVQTDDSETGSVSIIRITVSEREAVSETSVDLHHLTRLSVRKDFIEFCCR